MELSGELSHWTLQSDAKLFEHVAQLSESIISQSKCIHADLDDLDTFVKQTEVRLYNCLNSFEMLSNTQFIEHRVYDDPADEEKEKEETKLIDPLQLWGGILRQSLKSDYVPEKELVLPRIIGTSQTYKASSNDFRFSSETPSRPLPPVNHTLVSDPTPPRALPPPLSSPAAPRAPPPPLSSPAHPRAPPPPLSSPVTPRGNPQLSHLSSPSEPLMFPGPTPPPPRGPPGTGSRPATAQTAMNKPRPPPTPPPMSARFPLSSPSNTTTTLPVIQDIPNPPQRNRPARPSPLPVTHPTPDVETPNDIQERINEDEDDDIFGSTVMSNTRASSSRRKTSLTQLLGKGNLFMADDDELDSSMFSKQKQAPISTSKPAPQQKTKLASLFGDDDDDEGDLFSAATVPSGTQPTEPDSKRNSLFQEKSRDISSLFGSNGVEEEDDDDLFGLKRKPVSKPVVKTIKRPVLKFDDDDEEEEDDLPLIGRRDSAPKRMPSPVELNEPIIEKSSSSVPENKEKSVYSTEINDDVGTLIIDTPASSDIQADEIPDEIEEKASVYGKVASQHDIQEDEVVNEEQDEKLDVETESKQELIEEPVMRMPQTDSTDSVAVQKEKQVFESVPITPATKSNIDDIFNDDEDDIFNSSSNAMTVFDSLPVFGSPIQEKIHAMPIVHEQSNDELFHPSLDRPAFRHTRPSTAKRIKPKKPSKPSRPALPSFIEPLSESSDITETALSSSIVPPQPEKSSKPIKSTNHSSPQTPSKPAKPLNQASIPSVPPIKQLSIPSVDPLGKSDTKNKAETASDNMLPPLPIVPTQLVETSRSSNAKPKPSKPAKKTAKASSLFDDDDEDDDLFQSLSGKKTTPKPAAKVTSKPKSAKPVRSSLFGDDDDDEDDEFFNMIAKPKSKQKKKKDLSSLFDD